MKGRVGGSPAPALRVRSAPQQHTVPEAEPSRRRRPPATWKSGRRLPGAPAAPLFSPRLTSPQRWQPTARKTRRGTHSVPLKIWTQTLQSNAPIRVPGTSYPSLPIGPRDRREAGSQDEGQENNRPRRLLGNVVRLREPAATTRKRKLPQGPERSATHCLGKVVLPTEERGSLFR